MKKFIRVLIVVFALIIATDMAGSFYFYKIAVARTSKEFLTNSKDVEVAPVMIAYNTKYSWYNNKKLDDVEIKSEDGLKLKGYYLKADEPTKNTVILAHGYSSEGKDMVIYAKFYHEQLGYNVLMPDDRGHGESEGNYIGFGWKDRKDYLKWINYVIESIGKDSEIVLHGVSMGGATVLMTSGEDIPNNIKAIISDCAYTSVSEELTYQLKRMYKLPPFPILQSTSLLTKIKAGYFFGEASALVQVAKAKTPILFIHGGADTFVPVEMVNRLYEKCKSEKDIYIVPNAQHGTSYKDDKLGYEKKVTDFVSKYVTE